MAKAARKPAKKQAVAVRKQIPEVAVSVAATGELARVAKVKKPAKRNTIDVGFFNKTYEFDSCAVDKGENLILYLINRESRGEVKLVFEFEQQIDDLIKALKKCRSSFQHA